MLSRSALRQFGARAVRSQQQPIRSASVWANIQQGPPDAILGITEAYKADSHPQKISISSLSKDDKRLSSRKCPSPEILERKKRIPCTSTWFANSTSNSGMIETSYPATAQPITIVTTIYNPLSTNFKANKFGKYFGNKCGCRLTCRLLKF